MTQIGIWSVSETGPQKLATTNIDLERQLEDWIEQDPGLLESGLTVVGRQVRVEGGPLDVLAIDSRGRWTVIELKRGILYRDTFAQALDYSASIASMPIDDLSAIVSNYFSLRSSGVPASVKYFINDATAEQDQQQSLRDVRIILVGTDTDPGLRRLASYLANAYDIPTALVAFQVFDTGTGQRILLRELTETETEIPAVEKRTRLTVEDVCKQADLQGIGQPFRRILEAASNLGVYPRPYPTCVMYAPPSNRTRALFTVWSWTEQTGMIRIWIGPEAFAEFYPISQDVAESYVGRSGHVMLPVEQVSDFVQRLKQLYLHMEKEAHSSTD